MSHAATARQAAFWSIGGQYIAFATQFAVSVSISRFFLSPAEMGLYSVALSAAMMVSIFQDFGLSRFLSGSRELSAGEIDTSASIAFVVGFAIVLLVAALAWPMARFYHDARLLPLLLIVALSYVAVPFGIVPNALLLRRLDFRSIFLVNVGAALVNATVALGLAVAGWSAFALAWALVAQQAARMAIAWRRSGARLPLPLSFAGARPILRFGSGATGLYVSGAIGVRSPELIIGRVLTLAAVGFYGRASSLAAQLQTLLGGAVDSVFYSSFARLRDEGVDLAAPYQRVVAVYCGVTWPAMLFLSAGAGPIVRMLYGPRWAEVAPLLTMIALAQLFIAAVPLHVELPILLGRMRRLLALNVLDTAASVGLLVLGARYGIEGAALSRVAYGMVWFAIYIGFIRRLTGFDWRIMAGNYLRSLVAAAAAVAPLLATYRWLVPVDRLGFLGLSACAAAGCLTWLAAATLVGHPVRAEMLAMLAPLRERLSRARPWTTVSARRGAAALRVLD